MPAVGLLGRYRNVTRVPPTARRREHPARSGLPILLVALATGTTLSTASDAHAHAILMTFIRHEAKVVVGPRNIDIVLELTFYEYPSLAERRRMDRNHDDSISPEEVAGYLASLADTLRDGVTVSVDDRPVQVIPLYDPQVDLLGASSVAPSHHLLRLSYFARTPDWLHASSRIRAECRLWPETPRIDVLNAAGSDGIQIVPDDASGLPSSPEAATGPRIVTLSCQTAARPEMPLAAASGSQGMVRPRRIWALVAGTLSLCILGAVVLGGARKHVVRSFGTGGQT
jgi:hypothetical protein